MNNLIESLLFGIIMVIFGFFTSYFSDYVSKKNIDWIPDHAFGMASGIFNTSIFVYLLFSKKYLEYKCNKNVKYIND